MPSAVAKMMITNVYLDFSPPPKTCHSACTHISEEARHTSKIMLG